MYGVSSKPEGGISVRPAAHELAVEPDRGVGHGAVDVEEDIFGLDLRGTVKMFSVPSHAPPGQFAGIAGIFLLERSFYSPVVRQVQLPPLAVVEVGFCI